VIVASGSGRARKGEDEQSQKRLSSKIIAAPSKLPRIDVDTFAVEAERFGFDASSYLTHGFTVLQQPMLSDEELVEATAVARRVRFGGSNGEFVFLRHQANEDKRTLFALLYRYLPLLNQMFGGGVRLPFSDKAPYSHHNQVQVAIKQPGFEGYDQLANMYCSDVGHIDQPLQRQVPGRKAHNFSASFGIVLNGATSDRDDAGNLFVAPGTHMQFADKFQRLDGDPLWYPKIARHYFDRMPRMQAVRARPGQAILMHHQTIHGVAPNNSDQDRVHLYFRLTACGRPAGRINSYPEAMRDPTLETPLLRSLAAKQQ